MSDESSDGSTDALESLSEPSNSPPKKDLINKITESESKHGHPSTAEMVNEAIKELAERGGSSLVAIKKFIAEKYQIDPNKRAVFIKKYLKKSVTDGTLVQPKGRGASGSFKIPSATALAAQKREAKAAQAEAKTKSKIARKTSSKKIVSDDPTASSKKQASTKIGEPPTAAEQKKKTVKATKKPLRSPSKEPKSQKSTTNKKASTKVGKEATAADKKSKPAVKGVKKMPKNPSEAPKSPKSKQRIGRPKKVVVE